MHCQGQPFCAWAPQFIRGAPVAVENLESRFRFLPMTRGCNRTRYLDTCDNVHISSSVRPFLADVSRKAGLLRCKSNFQRWLFAPMLLHTRCARSSVRLFYFMLESEKLYHQQRKQLRQLVYPSARPVLAEGATVYVYPWSVVPVGYHLVTSGGPLGYRYHDSISRSKSNRCRLLFCFLFRFLRFYFLFFFSFFSPFVSSVHP